MEQEGFLRRFFIKLNLFQTNATDERSLRIQRWSTRLYIPLLLMAIIILLVYYTRFRVISKQIEVKNPSLSIYFDLYNNYENVKCSCTQISASYQVFVELSTLYHQVCFSDFISSKWIDFLFNNKTTMRYAIDFRATASNQFQILRELCQLSFNAINDGLETFYNSEFISGELLNEDLFKVQLEADILAFQSITTSNFRRSLTFMRSFVFGNELMSAIETGFTLLVDTYESGAIYPSPLLHYNEYYSSDGSECNCAASTSCYIPAGFYDFDILDTSGDYNLQQIFPRDVLDRWYIACWPAESLLSSTLESFYNETILDKLLIYVNLLTPYNNFTVLNASESSHFSPNTTIDALVEELFVEKWTTKLNYSSYFAQCRPQSCLYNINKRAQFLYIITTLLGLYGGLSVVLYFIIPYIVEFLVEWLERRSTLVAHPAVSVGVPWSCRELIRKIWHALIQLNLYKSQRQMELSDLEHQRWSTRIYIILLALALFILTVYSSVSIGTKIVQISNPSLSTVEKLQMQVTSLQCSCTVLSVSYEHLIQLEPNYHQVCLSEFITSKWIEGLNQIIDLYDTAFYYADFRYVSLALFQLLKSMCDLANDTVAHAIFEFGRTQLVTGQLLEFDLFEKQMDSVIQQFQLTLPNNLLRLLQLMRNMTYMNQFITGSYGNFFVDYATIQRYASVTATFGIEIYDSVLPDETSESCSCANSFNCGLQAAVYSDDEDFATVLYSVPNIYVRCFPIESLLASSLECFYDDQPCLDILASITNEALYTDITRLNASRPSRFSINTTVRYLLEQLFIDSWSKTLLYSSYFAKCQPAFCSYTIIERKSTLEIVTTITGLIGGLSVICRLLSPYIVSVYVYFLHRRRGLPRNTMIQQGINNSTRTMPVIKKLRDTIINLNMFEDVNRPLTGEHELHVQRQSTRVYILILSFTLFILIMYTSLIPQNNTVMVKISSLDTFQNLQKIYGSIVVKCPCTQLSIVRSTYIQLEPIFHQVCSSDFISTDWLNALFISYDTLKLSSMNAFKFRGTAFAHFQAMLIMCDLAKQAVLDARDLFLGTSIVSAQMMDFDLFDRETNTTLTNFQLALPNNFIQILQLCRGLVQGNGLVSAYGTNWNLFVPNMTDSATIYMTSQWYGECNCATSASCVQASTSSAVRGFVVGCTPLESFLRSTIECLYNQSCVNKMFSHVNMSYSPRVLDNNGSRFALNVPANTIVQQMFIESWSSKVCYENFFQQCQPISCSYTLIEQYNMLYVVTTLLGLYGGITVLLKLVIPFTMRQVYKIVRKFRQTTTPVLPMNDRY